MLISPNLGSSFLIQRVMISLKALVQLPWMWPGDWGQLNDIQHSVMAVEINKSCVCMWHVCGCCWLKVVVIIAGLKMTGGGCVPLIPYLISRSRGEALNPKHTHTLSHSLTNVSTYSQRLMQPLQHTLLVPNNYCDFYGFFMCVVLNTIQ